jgi:hypothetical protein
MPFISSSTPCLSLITRSLSQIGKCRLLGSATYSAADGEVFRTVHKRLLHRGSDAPVLLTFPLVRPAAPIAPRIPPQSGEGVRESGWRLGRDERFAKFVQGHGAIFSKYADTNDDVLLYAKVASPFVNR